MTNRNLLAIPVFATLLVSTACENTTLPNLTTIIITNSWAVEGQPDRLFFFESERDGRTSGTFTGREEIHSPDGEVFNDVEGFWENGRIEFTVAGTRGGALYTGAFRNLPRRLTVRSNDTDETIVLMAAN